jgi:Prokaryotic RING finger family 1
VSGRASRLVIRDGNMLVHAVGQVRRYEELLPMLEAALGVFDQAMLTRSVGIEFVTEDIIKPLDDATCRICGDRIGPDLVFCRVCKTPHHYDCWQYNGACSVYGCGETTYVRPRAAEIVSGPHKPSRPATIRPGQPDDSSAGGT